MKDIIHFASDINIGEIKSRRVDGRYMDSTDVCHLFPAAFTWKRSEQREKVLVMVDRLMYTRPKGIKPRPCPQGQDKGHGPSNPWPGP